MNNINMLQMGLNGTFLIVVIICFRHFFFHQIPKRFFVFLWICAIVRLLLPFSIPVSESAGSWFQKTVSRNLQMSGLKRQSQAEMRPDARSSSTEWAVGLSGTAFRERCDNLDALFGKNSADPDAFSVSADFGKAEKWVQNVAVIIYLKEVCCVIWLSVAGMLAAGILIKHICTLRLYKTSLPFYNETVEKWLLLHRSFPKAAIRRSEFVKSPLTYGVIRPVILFPSEISLNEEEFFCIMEHEWIHIRRKDVFVKYLLCLTICIYWFHPLVWMMAVFLNRDIEFASDEEVSRTCSQHCKTAYALALIRLAQESRQSVWPLNACFARHSEIEERIRFIMNTKRYSKKAAVVAAGIICCIMTAFTASAQETPGETASQVEHTRQSGAEIFPNESGAAEKQNIQENTTETEASDSLAGMGEVSDYGKESLASAANAAGEYTNISKEQQAAGEQIAELAKLYIGNPYKAGGTDLEYGTDSIGFVKAVYALAGIELPADIQALAAVGTEVPLETLIAGDLIIYSSADGENRFFHVAVYDGSGRAIHASNRKTGIKISDYDYREITKAIRIIR
jgi:Antirepressor regulating drug resistance, predicted signal transduction N-terminal membrane component